MPRRFLSKVERQRLTEFPDEVTDADCIVYFTLTPADKEFVESRRGDANRLGVALLLCSLRYLGYFPADIKHIPENVVAFVSDQLELSPVILVDYADRDETQWEHLPQVMSHLGFRRLQAKERQSLIIWLGERALEHDHPSLLLQQACERLYQLRIVRPAITTMEELVGEGRRRVRGVLLQIHTATRCGRLGQVADGIHKGIVRRGQSIRTYAKRLATGPIWARMISMIGT